MDSLDVKLIRASRAFSSLDALLPSSDELLQLLAASLGIKAGLPLQIALKIAYRPFNPANCAKPNFNCGEERGERIASGNGVSTR